MTGNAEKWLTTGQVGRAVGCEDKTIRRWLDGKRSPFPNAVRLPSGHWRIPQSDVDAFLKRGRVGVARRR